jgi:hypothetical protein
LLEREAREILGVTQVTSFSDIKKRYRQLAKLMHPDLAPADNSEQAAVAMGRINEAWATIEAREKSGSLGQSQDSSETITGRYPNSSECFMCGYTPATYFKAPSVVSFFIWGKYRGFEGVACKNCGTTMSRLAARDALRKGWWGLGILWMPNVIFNWLRNESKFNKMAPPFSRATDVVTLLSFPSPIAKSPAKDPMGLLASALAIIILVALSTSPSTSVSSTGGVDPSQFGVTGTCYTQDSKKGTVGLTSCDNTLGVFTSLGTATTQSACPIGSTGSVNIKNSDGTASVACLGPWGGVTPSKICYSLDGQPNFKIDCSNYPQISMNLCDAVKYANFTAVDDAGNILNTLTPIGGGVWKGVSGNGCVAPNYSFNFESTEVRRVGTYKYRINFTNTEDSKLNSAKLSGATIWTVVIS